MRLPALVLACLLPAAAVAQSVNRPMDLPFWQEVIVAPECPASELVRLLADARGRTQCRFDDDGQQRRCMGSAATLLTRLCGAGREHVDRLACMNLPGGEGDLVRGLVCLNDIRNWDRSRADPATAPLPRPPSRFQLQNEEPAPAHGGAPDAGSVAELRFLPPGALGLTAADLEDPARTAMVGAMAKTLILNWAETTLAALPTEAQVIGLPGLPMATRVQARDILKEIHADWTPELIADCRMFVTSDTGQSSDRRLWRAGLKCFGNPARGRRGQVQRLIYDAGILFGLLQAD